jgi:hypothetical protein
VLPRDELRVNGRLPVAFWVGVTLKAGLVVLLMVPLLRSDMEQYDGKGMSWRILVFPVAGLIIPALWRLTGARAPYPYLADNLVVLPPLLDVLWNSLDTYDSIVWWDDLNHLVNAAIFAAVIGLWASRYPLGAVTRYGLALGLGMTLQVLWEIGEYLTFLARSPNVADLYADTIGDLAFDLVGSMTGAAFAILAMRSVDEQVEPEPEPALART